MIAITDDPRGAILPVRARSGAKSNELVGERDGALLVAVTAPPEQGKANAAIAAVLAEYLNLGRGRIHLLSGATSRSKRFLIEEISAAELLNRIDAALEPTLYDPPDPEV
jgi:uncharacterized protein YggU (UPF0235/DUF167 family)